MVHVQPQALTRQAAHGTCMRHSRRVRAVALPEQHAVLATRRAAPPCRRPLMRGQHLRCTSEAPEGSSSSGSQPPSSASVEETTRKWGLEAGLWKARWRLWRCLKRLYTVRASGRTTPGLYPTPVCVSLRAGWTCARRRWREGVKASPLTAVPRVADWPSVLVQVFTSKESADGSQVSGSQKMSQAKELLKVRAGDCALLGGALARLLCPCHLVAGLTGLLNSVAYAALRQRIPHHQHLPVTRLLLPLLRPHLRRRRRRSAPGTGTRTRRTPTCSLPSDGAASTRRWASR
jgi:hypothetical protein